MVSNNSRFDPYKNFKFRVMLGAALVGLTAFVIAKKTSLTKSDTRASRRNAFWRMFG